MLPTNLKAIVKEKIDNLENVELLEDILSIINNEDSNVMVELSEEQTAAIEIGLEDIRKGNVISNKKANNEIDEWLKK